MGNAQAKTTIKVAVVTPEGSAWGQMLDQMAAEVKAQTHGEVNFIIYPGGISGDESDVLRKMQVNRLQGCGLSGAGIGIILPEIRVLETPLLIKTDAEIDQVREEMFDTFAEDLAKEGWSRLLGIYRRRLGLPVFKK